MSLYISDIVYRTEKNAHIVRNSLIVTSSFLEHNSVSITLCDTASPNVVILTSLNYFGKFEDYYKAIKSCSPFGFLEEFPCMSSGEKAFMVAVVDKRAIDFSKYIDCIEVVYKGDIPYDECVAKVRTWVGNWDSLCKFVEPYNTDGVYVIPLLWLVMFEPDGWFEGSYCLRAGPNKDEGVVVHFSNPAEVLRHCNEYSIVHYNPFGDIMAKRRNARGKISVSGVGKRSLPGW